VSSAATHADDEQPTGALTNGSEAARNLVNLAAINGNCERRNLVEVAIGMSCHHAVRL
jgi:hypothetical protein